MLAVPGIADPLPRYVTDPRLVQPDARCLRFYENERAVRTASSEQVRQPIFREGLDQWRHYEPWLGPLRESLGPTLAVYPDIPPC